MIHIIQYTHQTYESNVIQEITFNRFQKRKKFKNH